MDTKTLVHVGTELIVVASLSFYFNNQLRLLREENASTKIELQDLKNIVNKQGQMINAMLTGSPPPQNQQKQSNQQQRQPSPPRQQRPPSPVRQQRQSQSQNQSSPPTVVRPRQPQPSKELTDEELDSQLMEEFDNLNKEIPKKKGIKKRRGKKNGKMLGSV